MSQQADSLIETGEGFPNPLHSSILPFQRKQSNKMRLMKMLTFNPVCGQHAHYYIFPNGGFIYSVPKHILQNKKNLVFVTFKFVNYSTFRNMYSPN